MLELLVKVIVRKDPLVASPLLMVCHAAGGVMLKVDSSRKVLSGQLTVTRLLLS